MDRTHTPRTDRRPVVHPDITVVIPTLGRPLLEATLRSIAAGTAWPATLVVSQQGSETAPADWVADLRDLGMHVVHVINDEHGVAAATNRGLEQVDTALVLVTHDDCTVTPTWIDDMGSCLRSHPGKVIVGTVAPEAGADVPSTITAPDPFEVTEPRLGNDPLFPNNMGLPTSAVRDVGLFDEDPRLWRAAEDCDYSYRLLRAGVHIRYEPGPTVTHADWRHGDELDRTYTRYAFSIGALYGMHIRRGDRYMLKRAAYDLARTPWFILRGIVTGHDRLRMVGMKYARHLIPGILEGLRREPRIGRIP